MKTTLALWIGILVLPPNAALGQSAAAPAGSAATYAKALDQRVDALTLEDLEVTTALEKIGKQAGVPITIDDGALDFLPWGGQTKLETVSVTDATYHEALSQILGAVGLSCEVTHQGVRVAASEVLKRSGRRATWDELSLLRHCQQLDYSPENLATLKLQLRITSKVDAKKMLDYQLSRSGRGSVAEMLDTATAALGWTWFVEDDHIVVRTLEAQNAVRLSRRLTIRYDNLPLTQVLADLAERAGVAISFEPGLSLKLRSPMAQNCRLVMQGTSIRQAFEMLSAETGIAYQLTRDGISVRLAEVMEGSTARDAPSNGRASPYFAKLSVPGLGGAYSLEFLIRADELPPELLETREQMMKELIQKLRKEVATEASPRDPAVMPSSDEKATNP